MKSVDLLYQELKGILASPNESTTYRYRCEFIIGDLVIPMIKILGIDRVNKYDTDWMDGIKVVGTLPLGTYNTDVYPNRKKVKVSLVREIIDTKANAPRKDRPTYTQLYDCTFLDTSSNVLMDASDVTANKALADRDHTTTIAIQLVESTVNQYRAAEVSGILRGCTVLDALRLLVTSNTYGEDESLPEPITLEQYADGDYNTVVGCDVIAPDNTRVYQTIVIPTGTKLIDLPDYLQLHYGVYNKGLGNYLYRGIVYVYPLFNYGRTSDTPRILTIGNFAENIAPGATSTWKLKPGGEVYIAATGATGHLDLSDWRELNEGIVTYSKRVDTILDASVSVKNGVAYANIGNSLVFTDPYDRLDLGSHVRLSTERQITNTYRQATKISANRTGMLLVEWESSNDELVYPGMPIRLLFAIGDNVREITGVLTSIDTQIKPVKEGLTDTYYVSHSSLGINIPAIGD